jgi:hypothetical protein
MEVTIASVSDLVDRFEEMLLGHAVSIPRHPQTGAEQRATHRRPKRRYKKRIQMPSKLDPRMWR